MSDATRAALRRAFKLSKTGKRSEALHIVQQIIMEDDRNVQAWWLMANVVDSPQDQHRALSQVLALQPAHRKARTQLTALLERYPRLADGPGWSATPTADRAETGLAHVAQRRGLLLMVALGLMLIVLLLLLVSGTLV